MKSPSDRFMREFRTQRNIRSVKQGHIKVNTKEDKCCDMHSYCKVEVQAVLIEKQSNPILHHLWWLGQQVTQCYTK